MRGRGKQFQCRLRNGIGILLTRIKVICAFLQNNFDILPNQASLT